VDRLPVPARDHTNGRNLIALVHGVVLAKRGGCPVCATSHTAPGGPLTDAGVHAGNETTPGRVGGCRTGAFMNDVNI
jgi:hypothetical protein